jgi:hypothetical protein
MNVIAVRSEKKVPVKKLVWSEGSEYNDTKLELVLNENE